MPELSFPELPHAESKLSTNANELPNPVLRIRVVNHAPQARPRAPQFMTTPRRRPFEKFQHRRHFHAAVVT
jgi:hypothetical protein